MVDASRLMLIAGLAFVLYLAAGVMLVQAMARWVRRKLFAGGNLPEATPPNRLARAGRIAVLVLAGLGLLCAGYARFVEPNWPVVKQVTIRTPKLPAGGRPVRLVLIADTHSDPEARLEPRLPAIVAGLKPDLIVFAGDALNSEPGLGHFRELMTQLASIAPTCAVRGNWDVWYFRDANLYAGTGVQVLDGRGVPVRAGGSELWLAGFEVPTGGRHSRDDYLQLARRALSGVPPGRLAIFVHHYPEVAALGVEAGAELGLAADTHGGQLRLPLIGALLRLNRLGKYWEPGLHGVGAGAGQLYVNQGLGMEGGAAPRARFLCRPEIALIEIAPEVVPAGDAPAPR